MYISINTLAAGCNRIDSGGRVSQNYVQAYQLSKQSQCLLKPKEQLKALPPSIDPRFWEALNSVHSLVAQQQYDLCPGLGTFSIFHKKDKFSTGSWSDKHTMISTGVAFSENSLQSCQIHRQLEYPSKDLT